MAWLYFYLVPLFAAWKRRSNDLASEVFSLYKSMFATFLSIWCIPIILKSLSHVLPADNVIAPWAGTICIVIIWLTAAFAFGKVIDKIVPEGLESFFFPPKAVKIMVPVIAFLNVGLICAALFSAVSFSPASKYASFIFKDDSLCASARLRVLSSSFFIDRFSLQTASINQRRRAFDHFVPEFPNDVAAARRISTAALKRKVR